MVMRTQILAAYVIVLGLLPGASAFAQLDQSAPRIPGMVVEPIGQRAKMASGNELTLARVHLAPDAAIPAELGPPGAVIAVEAGRVSVELVSGEATLTLADAAGSMPLPLSGETVIVAGDAVAYDDGSTVAVRNPAAIDAKLLYAALVTPGEALFATPSAPAGAGTFSVETWACPAGMTLVTLDIAACTLADRSLVEWSLASEEFHVPVGIDHTTVDGPVTIWTSLPDGVYFVDLTAEDFAPGYGDYFIPSSNQVTRQDERTTQLYIHASELRGAVRAYVFPKG
jgi:hypothetical protein